MKIGENKGFTAIELLAVLAIILTIVSIGIPAYNSWRNRNKIEKTKAIISKLEMALEMYKTDFGEYPDSLSKLIEVESPISGSYIDSKDYKNDNFYDPWDKPINYKIYTENETIKLTSNGPDEKLGTDDDICNIEVE